MCFELGTRLVHGVGKGECHEGQREEQREGRAEDKGNDEGVDQHGQADGNLEGRGREGLVEVDLRDSVPHRGLHEPRHRAHEQLGREEGQLHGEGVDQHGVADREPDHQVPAEVEVGGVAREEAWTGVGWEIGTSEEC